MKYYDVENILISIYFNNVWILYLYGKKIVIGFDPGGFTIELMNSCRDNILIGEYKLRNTRRTQILFPSMTMYHFYQHVIL